MEDTPMPATATKPTRKAKGNAKPEKKGVARLAVLARIRPQQIEADLSDNPRFWIKGKDPEDVARAYFASAEYADLAKSFQAEGIINPIVVHENGDGTYQLIDGWTRLEWAKRRAKNNKNFTIPATVHTGVSDRVPVQRIVANLARNGYEPLAEAAAFKRLLEKVDGEMAQVVRMTGRSRGTVMNRLRLLELPKELQRLLDMGRINQVAADRVTKLPGFDEFVKSQTDDENMTEAEWEACERFDKAVKFIVKQIDTTHREKGTKQFTDQHIIKFHNKWLNHGTTFGKSKAAAPKIVVDEVIETCPSDDSLNRFIAVYAREVVRAIRAGTPENDPEVQHNVHLITALGTAAGWCASPELVDEYVDDEGEAVYGAQVAAEKCNDTVRSFLTDAFMEMERREIPKGHDLSDDAKYKAFYRRPIPYAQLLTELETVTVPIAANRGPKGGKQTGTED